MKINQTTHTTHLLHLVALALLCAAPLHAQKQKTQSAPAPQPVAQLCSMPGKDYYLKHLGAGMVIAMALNILEAPINALGGDIPKPLFMAGKVVAGSYLAYKTPQLIDTYLLKNGMTYTTKQNIIRCFPTLQLGNYLVQKQKYNECCTAAGVCSQ